MRSGRWSGVQARTAPWNAAGRGAGSSKTITTGGFWTGGGYTTVTFDEGGYHWPRAPVASAQNTKLRTSNVINAFLHGPCASRRHNALRRRPKRTPHLVVMMIRSAGAGQNERCNSSRPAPGDSESVTCDFVRAQARRSTTAEFGSGDQSRRLLRLRQGKRDITLRDRGRTNAARGKPSAGRERIASGDSEQHILPAIDLVNGRHAQGAIRKLLRGEQLSGIFVQRVELGIISGEQDQPARGNRESAFGIDIAA